MEWTQESVIEFIELYKRKEIIWNPKHPMHFNKIKKQDAWEELGKEMNRTVDECKKKMENLLSSLRRVKMKMRKSSGTGKARDEVYKSSWFAYESLRFIMDKTKPQQTLNTVSATLAQPPCKRMKKPSAPVSAEHLISVATSYLQKEDDEFFIMAKGYAAKMKKLTPDQLIFADRVITETLVEAQMGKLTRWTSLSTDTSPVLSTGASPALSTTFSCDESDDTSINN